LTRAGQQPANFRKEAEYYNFSGPHLPNMKSITEAGGKYRKMCDKRSALKTAATMQIPRCMVPVQSARKPKACPVKGIKAGLLRPVTLYPFP
jgi:hypothetical protein